MPDGATRGSDGKIRAVLTYAQADPGPGGTVIEMRHGGKLSSKEWWKVGPGELDVTKRQVGDSQFPMDPPEPDLKSPSDRMLQWRSQSKDEAQR